MRKIIAVILTIALTAFALGVLYIVGNDVKLDSPADRIIVV